MSRYICGLYLAAISGLFSFACTQETSDTSEKNEAASKQRTDQDNAAQESQDNRNNLNLYVPNESDMIRLRTAVASRKLGRIVQISETFGVGYHAPTPYASPDEKSLDDEFLSALYRGEYNKIGELKSRFAALFPNGDPTKASGVTLARMGFLNLWQFSERYRLINNPGASFAEDMKAELFQSIGACANFYASAVAAAPDNAVYRGFAADCALFMGLAPGGAPYTLKGLEYAFEAIRRVPEFNLFTVGYALTSLPLETNRAEFDLGLEMLFKTLDICLDAKIDRNNPDVSPYMKTFDPTFGNKKYCYNTDIAAHNFEGFFLILGDVLLKSGKIAAGKTAYAQAKLLPSFSNWPYRELLEARIAAADQLAMPFAQPVDPMTKPYYPTITFNSEYSCMVCHRK